MGTQGRPGNNTFNVLGFNFLMKKTELDMSIER